MDDVGPKSSFFHGVGLGAPCNHENYINILQIAYAWFESPGDIYPIHGVGPALVIIDDLDPKSLSIYGVCLNSLYGN